MRLSPDRVVRLAGALSGGAELSTEQRRDTRLTLRGTATVAVLGNDDDRGPAFGARVCDVSAGGVGLLLHHPLRKGDRLLVTLPAIDDEPGLPVICVVRHVRMAGERLYRVGTAFVSILANDGPTTPCDTRVVAAAD